MTAPSTTSPPPGLPPAAREAPLPLAAPRPGDDGDKIEEQGREGDDELEGSKSEKQQQQQQQQQQSQADYSELEKQQQQQQHHHHHQHPPSGHHQQQPYLASSSSSSSCHEPSSTTDYQRLGRARPPVLSSRLVEVGFVATIVLSMMLSEYFIGGFNIVLPPLADALAIAPAARTWPAGVTNLTTAALLQPFSRLCDMYGARPVFLAGQAWLLVWSLVAGFSVDGPMLIACRAMQGLGAAAFLPAGLALLSQTYRPGPRKNLVFSVYGAFACIGFYFGILVGAAAAEYLSWRWYFWIGALLGLVVALSGFVTIPRSLHPESGPAAVAMDWWGVFTIVPGLVLVVFAFTDGGHAPDGWRTPYIYVALGLGLVFLAAAVYVEGWVAEQPLLPPDLFRHRYIKRLMAALFCSYGVFGLFLFYASFYIEIVLETRPILTAAWFTPLAVGGIFLAICGGLVLHIISNRLLMMISAAGFFLSTLLFALLPDQETSGRSTAFLYWAYIFPAMLAGTIGVDITFNVTNVFITTAMPRRHQAAASGLINSLLYLGIAFWLGIGELAVSATVQRRGEASVSLREQYQIGFWTGVALSVTSFCLIVTVKMGQAEATLTADEKADLERETNATT